MPDFAHLHVHTQFSILDGASDIDGLLDKVKETGMNAIAITDHGNMFGVKQFHKKAVKKGVKPIIGCEIYIAEKSRFEKTGKEDRSGFHLVLLAKNKTGYQNLIRLVSDAWLEGFYYTPRIDKELLFKYKEGLIVSTACIAGEIPYHILEKNPEKVDELILEFKKQFGDDFCLEIQRHPTGEPKMDAEVYERQMKVSEEMKKLSEKHDIKCIATNDVHFINAEDAGAHDILICLNTNKDINDENRMRYTKQEYLKTPDEMKNLFSDFPEAIANTLEIVEKVENYPLDCDPIMPDFPLPEGFDDADEYLKHLSYKGAEIRYEEMTGEIKERLDFELSVIKNMGFPGYFLIVQDVINTARKMGVSVGPGRGSAAGSLVSYCTGITDIDPVKYNLLFERFLNPDRISMPDIDIDFDEEGRDEVLNWVVDKYGKEKVAHIITFGTMAAKLAIRDVARVLTLPLPEADRLAKLIPDGPGWSLTKAYKEVPELKKEKKSENELVAKTLQFAGTLEGSVRQTGLHACGIIIGKDDLREYIPIATHKDTSLWVTQYDGKLIEDVGMLKMDFLGLKTLSIIKDAVENVKRSHDIDLDIANVALDDEKTYELYSRGETTGLFQFESAGMKKYLKQLKPNRFEDLIAMNALYRPGPMEYIPSYINRKYGKEKISYDLPEMNEILKDTYGITVYQEQVMQLSQKLAGFTKGMADSLRKGMGKKKREIIDELKPKFIDGCRQNNIETSKAEKIWKDWEAFAEYAFNKSHSTCYAYISYQTAYLKAHYPAEFMAAVVSRNLSDIKKVTVFMDECRRMGLEVLGPDVNESVYKFNVNKEGNIRFGLGAIKGVGENAVINIIEEREQNGCYKDIYDFMERVNLHSVNKKSIEALAIAGAFDNLSDFQRYQYFVDEDVNESSFIELLIKYGSKRQIETKSIQQSLFGGNADTTVARPKPPKTREWTKMEMLKLEKDYIGIYLSSHPLDIYKLEIEKYCYSTPLTELQNLPALLNKQVNVVGIVSNAAHRMTKNGKPFGNLTLEDYTDSYKFTLFGKDYHNFNSYLTMGYSLLIKGKVQMREWGDNKEPEFKVQSMHMLSEVKENMIKNIAFKISLENLSNEFLEEFQNQVENNKGKVNLKFLIYEPGQKTWVQMFSRSHKISLSEDFLNYINKNVEIEKFELS